MVRRARRGEGRAIVDATVEDSRQGDDMMLERYRDGFRKGQTTEQESGLRSVFQIRGFGSSRPQGGRSAGEAGRQRRQIWRLQRCPARCLNRRPLRPRIPTPAKKFEIVPHGALCCSDLAAAPLRSPPNCLTPPKPVRNHPPSSSGCHGDHAFAIVGLYYAALDA